LFYVLEQGRAVVILDEGGQWTKRVPLPLEPGDRASFLRVADDGSAFAVGTAGGRRLYWFDADWQLVRVLPGSQLGHDGLRDAAFLRHPQSGTVTLCGAFAGPGGVRVWKSTDDELWEVALPHVQNLVTQADGGLVAADAAGRIQRIDPQGRPQPAPDKIGHGIFRLYSSSAAVDSDADATYVGLSYDPDGQRVVYGLNKDFQARWEYRMPAGPHLYPVEWISSGFLPAESPHWILASPDGAIHMISFDGREHDYYYTGTHISGLATSALAGQGALLVSADGEVSAWHFLPKQPIGTETDGVSRIAPPNQLHERR
jgi:hypothetical protein